VYWIDLPCDQHLVGVITKKEIAVQKRKTDTRKSKKLMLHTETLRILNEQEIQIVVGAGYDVTLYSCSPTDCWEI
jgi:hypothetical protein